MKKLLGLMVSVIVLASPLLARKKEVDPASFTLTAEVVAVTSKEVTTGITDTTPAQCKNIAPDDYFNIGYCAGRDRKKVNSETVYLVDVKIGNLLYTIESQDMPPIGAKWPAKIEGNTMTFCHGTDKKGRPHTWFRKIVGVREIPVAVKGETSRPNP